MSLPKHGHFRNRAWRREWHKQEFHARLKGKKRYREPAKVKVEK